MSKHPNAATALAAAQTEFPPITKTKTVEVRTKTGGTYTFDYATHDKIRAGTVPVLAAHGLVVAQPLTNLNGQPAVKTILLHESGDSIEETFPLPLRPDMTAQEVGSAITYIRRYAWVAMLGLVADDDDDGNHAAGNTVKPVGTASAATVSRDEHPAPVAASPSFVAQAQAAQANRPAPADGGDPGAVVVHFGKNQGRALSDLSKKQVEWYATTWEPNPKYASDEDRRLKMAAQMYSGFAPAAAGPSDVDSIPFY